PHSKHDCWETAVRPFLFWFPAIVPDGSQGFPGDVLLVWLVARRDHRRTRPRAALAALWRSTRSSRKSSRHSEPAPICALRGGWTPVLLADWRYRGPRRRLGHVVRWPAILYPVGPCDLDFRGRWGCGPHQGATHLHTHVRHVRPRGCGRPH